MHACNWTVAGWRMLMLLSGLPKRAHITPVLKSSHSLPDGHRVKFKIILWFLNHWMALPCLIKKYVPAMSLTSSSSSLRSEWNGMERQILFVMPPNYSLEITWICEVGFYLLWQICLVALLFRQISTWLDHLSNMEQVWDDDWHFFCPLCKIHDDVIFGLCTHNEI